MALVETWHWDEESFVHAWESGVFGTLRVELVEGEVWPVSIGEWHGAVTANVTRMLPNSEWRITSASLPLAGSVVDPDVWVHRRGTQPIAHLGAEGRIARWAPPDVALVVEVSDTTYDADVTIKARIYGSAGCPVYWVVHRDGVEEFSEPYYGGYRIRRTYPPDEAMPVPYADGRKIPVDNLLDVD